MKQNASFITVLPSAFLLILLVSAWSCGKEKSRIPAWIEIDSLGLSAKPGQGSGSHAFSDAWVYADGNLLGAFELPARVPVLPQSDDSTLINIFAGIRQDGLTATRTPYLKTVGYEKKFLLAAGETFRINPVYAYHPSLKFVYLEDFESLFDESVTRSEGAAGEFEQTQGNPAMAFEGTGYGVLRHAGAENTTAQIETFEWFTLPKNDVGGIYLEFNYNCNTPFTVSLLCKPNDGSADTKTGMLGLYPTNGEWKKIYIALSPAVTAYTAGNRFKPVMEYSRQTDIATQEVYLDNLKILF